MKIRTDESKDFLSIAFATEPPKPALTATAIRASILMRSFASSFKRLTQTRLVQRYGALWLLFFLSFALLACHQNRSISSISLDGQTQKPATLSVSAAASLQSPLKDIQTVYEQQQETRILYNFGASGAIAQQIAQGAPVDVFLSASENWMNELSEKKSIQLASRKCLLTNALVLVVPSHNTRINRLQDLQADSSDKIAVGEPQSVPVGQYTQEALQSLGLLEALSPQLVFGKDARQVLAYVETENAAAGIVYTTDAMKSEQVKVVERVSPQAHSPIVYSVAVTQDSENVEAAQTFLSFLFKAEARTIFERYGFERMLSSQCPK